VRTFVRIVAAVCSGFIVLALILYVTVLRSAYYQPYYQERSKTGTNWRTNGVTVAVVWPNMPGPSFPEGIQMALEEINESKSPLSGKVRLKRFVEPVDSSGRGGAEIAQRVVRDGSVIAVLGHQIAASAIPASIVYEGHGVLFLTPGSTDPRLTTHQFLYTFRLTPSDREIAEAMAKFAVTKGWHRVGLFFAQTQGAEALAPRLREQAAAAGLELAFEQAYLPGSDVWEDQQDFRPGIAKIRREKVDAILIADQLPRAAKLVRDLRTMGEFGPILGCDKLDSQGLWALAGPAANNVFVASAVDPDSTTPEYIRFRDRFRKEFGANPGFAASQGFEALHLLVQAGERSHTADPLVVSTSLHEYPFTGLFGPFEFSDWGDIECRTISIKQMTDSVFSTVYTTMPITESDVCRPKETSK
jgi:branched-chain amino acid transport system substrate-binding protein